MSEKQKKLWADPDYRKRILEARKGYRFTEERKRAVGRKSRQVYQEHPEYRDRLRAVHTGNKYTLGRKMSVEERQRLSEAMKGLKKTEVHRKHLSEAKKGKPLSDAHRKALSESRKAHGVLPPSQKGRRPWNYMGKSTLKALLKDTHEYRLWRSDVYHRDDFTCQECGLKGGKLHAHHKKKFATIIREYGITTVAQALECAELWNINNGQTLCEKCHPVVEKRDCAKYN